MSRNVAGLHGLIALVIWYNVFILILILGALIRQYEDFNFAKKDY